MVLIFQRHRETCRYICAKMKKVASKFLISFLVSFTLLSLVFLISCTIKSPNTLFQVIYIDSLKPSPYQVHPKFLSLGLDSIVVADGFKNFNFTNKKLIKIMRYMQPAYLRIGGNLADKLHFSPEDNYYEYDVDVINFYKKCDIENCDYINAPNYTMTGSDWKKLVELSKHAKMDIIFDLNVLIRFNNGSWDYRNAESLIKFSSDHNFKLNWELGNEPNAFRHKFHEVVNATQLAKDFNTLKEILKKYPVYNKSLLVGPDTSSLRSKGNERYLESFLQNGIETVDATTWHHYYINGRTAKPKDFLNPKIYDTLEPQIKEVRNMVRNLSNPEKPVWLGETSSAFGGGAPGLSDRFIGSFIWLDKLGLSAKLGIDVVIRQSIFRGNYALLDENYDPNPDWWVSLLYKALIGPEVVPYYTACTPSVRLYCHCTNKLVFSNPFVPSITVFGMNLQNTTALVRIEGLLQRFLKYKSKNYISTVYAFELTADDTLFSKSIRLNGRVLNLLPNLNLPKLVPKIIDGSSYVTMPAQSIVFWVVPDVRVAACFVPFQ